LREGGVLDLSAPSLSQSQFDALVELVVQRVSARLGPESRSYNNVAAGAPPPPPPPPPRQWNSVPVPARSAPVESLRPTVRFVSPKAPAAPAPPKAAQASTPTPAAAVPTPAAAKTAQTHVAGTQKGKALKPALSSHPMQTRASAKAQPAQGAPAGGVKPSNPSAPAARETLSGSHENPITLTTAKHSPASRVAKVLSPTPVLHSWQRCKKGVPLAQAIQYCKSKGLPVGLRLESS
jgi:hypothetical protein